jgi:hypothetical protein
MIDRRPDWKAFAGPPTADYAAAAKRPWQRSEPTITHLPSPPEPPKAEVTLQRIPAVLQASQQRESQPAAAAQSSTASQADGHARKTRQQPPERDLCHAIFDRRFTR